MFAFFYTLIQLLSANVRLEIDTEITFARVLIEKNRRVQKSRQKSAERETKELAMVSNNVTKLSYTEEEKAIFSFQ